MTQKSSKIPKFDAVLYKNENNTWFSSVLLCMYWRIIHGYQYIHGKTDENHVLFSNYLMIKIAR